MTDEERKAFEAHTEEACRPASLRPYVGHIRIDTRLFLAVAAEVKRLREENERLQKLWDLDRTAKEHFMRRAKEVA